MLTSTTAVLLACLGFVISDLVRLRKRLAGDLSTLAQVVGSNSVAALTFGDHQGAHEVLNALRARPSIVVACLYTDRGVPFARYEPNASITSPGLLLKDGFHAQGDRLGLFYPITLGHQRVGTLYIASDSRDRDSLLKDYAAIAAGIVLVSLLFAFVLSSRLQRNISGPIVELARVADLVSRHKNYSIRASPRGFNEGDEIDHLILGFNGMLAEIEQRDDRLLVAKSAAEKAATINAQLARESALILNSATDGILGINLGNEATFINPAGVRMLGMTLDDFRGTTIHATIHHSHPDGKMFPEEECANTLAMRRGQPVANADDTFWRSDGTNFPVEYSSTPMLDEDGNHLGAVVVFRDVTERRAIETLKSEFVSTVSHELRTPLTSIRGALGLLSSGLLGTVAEKGQRMLEIAVANTDRLVRLINDILDLERVESGKVELTRGRIDAQTVVNQAREGLQSIADQEGIRIVVQPFTGTLWGDSDRVIQTLTNLIGNAIKFSPPNTTVTVSGSAGATEFTFCVADQGRGVPEENLATIFQRFKQVDASDSRLKGGSGLGLAICQSIVTAHGGRIWAEKNKAAGTRVQFTIPLAAGEPASHLSVDFPASQPAAPIDRDAPSVLIVEDDSDLARVMSEALQRHGLQTSHTTRGKEALKFCIEQQPSLIVLDLTLPDLDGFSVVCALRRNPALAHLPLLVYSALDVGSADQSRLRLGRTEFLTKSRGSMADFESRVLSLLATAHRKKDEPHAA